MAGSKSGKLQWVKKLLTESGELQLSVENESILWLNLSSTTERLT